MAPLHPKANILEHEEKSNDSNVKREIQAPPQRLAQRSSSPVDAEPSSEDGKVERGVVVVDVGHTGHGDEGGVVQDPTDDGVDAGVVDEVDVGLAEFVVAALPADKVPEDEQAEDAQAGGGAPVDDGVAEEEVLDDEVVPGAHAETLEKCC